MSYYLWNYKYLKDHLHFLPAVNSVTINIGKKTDRQYLINSDSCKMHQSPTLWNVPPQPCSLTGSCGTKI